MSTWDDWDPGIDVVHGYIGPPDSSWRGETVPCWECDGTGYIADHDPSCFRTARCETTCPVQTRCPLCEGGGVLVSTARTRAHNRG